MVFYRGKFIKDMKYLNRNLKKVVVVDRSKEQVKKNKENVIVIEDYEGNENDEELLKLMVLLEGNWWGNLGLGSEKVEDVRTTLAKLGENPADEYY